MAIQIYLQVCLKLEQTYYTIINKLRVKPCNEYWTNA